MGKIPDEQIVDISKDIQYTVNEALDIAMLASDIINTASPLQQNKLLSLVPKDCYLDGQKLIYNLQKPFDKLVNLQNAENWFDFDKSDTQEYELLAEQIEDYKFSLENMN